MSKVELPVNPSNVFYYPSLDGLRFMAFFIVFLHHSLLNIQSNNIFLNYFLVIFQKNGWVGVDLFFVLSGFLITSLLLKEKQNNGSYSIRDFWIRRSLRIWPLYFLGLVMGFFIFPFLFTFFFKFQYQNLIFEQQINSQLPLYVLFLGNWAVVNWGYSAFANISHLWTISVEEQFYFLWPLILLFINNFRKTLLVGVIILSISLLTRFYLALSGISHPGIYTNTLARMDTLTLGAILALICTYHPTFLKYTSRFVKPLYLILILIIFSVFLYRVYLFDPKQIMQVTFGFLLVGLFMTYFVISALIPFPGLNQILTIKQFVWLGKISFGLYVWHIAAINITHEILKNMPIKLLHIFISFLITIIFAYTSYYLLERRFLKLKQSFTKITSRPI